MNLTMLMRLLKLLRMRLWVIVGLPSLMASVLALEGCSVLKPVNTPPTAYFSLDDPSASPQPVAAVRTLVRSLKPTLIINPPSAAAGYGSSRIIYLRQAHKIEYFAHSEWVESPARMLAPLMVSSLQASGTFQAVVLTPSAVAADWRLNTEIIRLQHEFFEQPSRVRFTLRAHLVDEKSRRILGVREFDLAIKSESDNPYGGVLAANLVIASVLRDLTKFCAEVALEIPVAK